MQTQTTEVTLSQMLDAGAKAWTPSRGGETRYYLNDWAEVADGLDVSFYKTGNVSGATLDGERLSNNRASKLLAGTKVYWTESRGLVVENRYNDVSAYDLEDRIKRGLEALVRTARCDDCGEFKPSKDVELIDGEIVCVEVCKDCLSPN